MLADSNISCFRVLTLDDFTLEHFSYGSVRLVFYDIITFDASPTLTLGLNPVPKSKTEERSFDSVHDSLGRFVVKPMF